MYQGLGGAVNSLFYGIIVLLCIFVPLGLWKMVDIIIWIYSNIHFYIGIK